MPYLDDLDVPQVPSDVANAAAGIDLATLKNWTSASGKRALIFVSEAEKKAKGSRKFYNFTIRRVMQLAITAAGVRLGLAPSAAAYHATYFTDAGCIDRMPGLLYSQGNTLLLVYAGYGSSETKVMNVDPHDQTAMQYTVLCANPGATIINLNVIERRVRAVLGLPPLERKGAYLP
jgi:hypothetical protein